MKIGVLSDIHGKTDHASAAVKSMRKHGCTRIICLGDICRVHTLNSLIDDIMPMPLDFIHGNNERFSDMQDFIAAAAAYPQITYHGESALLSIDNLRIFLTHILYAPEVLIERGNYNVILYGHTHHADARLIGACLVANPGEIQGRTGKVTYGILDTKTRQFDIIRVL